MTGQDVAAAREFQRHRPRLLDIAYRLLGSAWDAEDMVEEVAIRWLQTDRRQVVEPVAFLTTVMTRLALGHLKSAQVRRESYYGPWLPEPIPAGQGEFGPLETVEHRESLSLATMQVLTTFHADEYVLRALRAGASGFLLKDTKPAEILRAISRVAAGEPILSPAVTRQLIAHLGDTGENARRQHARSMLGRLSEREREVAVAVGRGRSNAEISGELFMSVATVKAHVSYMLTKLDLNNRTQIALLAHDAGLI